MRVQTKRRLALVGLLAPLTGAGMTAACGSTATEPSSNPADVIPMSHYGPVQISFVSANPPPGSSISGCGGNPTGCQGRVTMTFRLRSATDGRLRSAAVYLFDAGGDDGCLGMTVSPTTLQAGVDLTTTVRVDIANQFCPLPLTVDRMTFTIQDEDSVRSQQEFRIRYAFFP